MHIATKAFSTFVRQPIQPKPLLRTAPRVRGLIHSPSGHILLHHKFLEDIHATISTITLNRASAANAMGKIMMSEFQEILRHLEDESDSRCVILTSSVPKVFSGGADLKERKTMTILQAQETVDTLRATMERVARLPMPVVAAVEGVAVGGGLELALAADLRIVSKSAVFGLPETSLAILPGAGGTQRLPRLIGIARAKELIWTARRIDASTAERYGLVEKVVEDGETLTAAIEIATKIASNGPVAVRASKYAVDEGMTFPSMDEALDVERKAYTRVLETSDRLEGLAAFQEERPPKYTGY